MIRTAFPMFGALALMTPAVAKAPKFPPSTGQSAEYACADGRTIEVLYSGGDAAVVTTGGTTIQLARVGSADGERYVGGGWQWWGRGLREGMLSRAGAGETTSVGCHVR